MVFSHFWKLTHRSVIVASVALTASAFGQSVTIEGGKRPSSLSATQASSSAPQAPYEPDPEYLPSALTARYPAQSIKTVEQANQAIADVKESRRQIELVFKRDEKACYKTFFANRCVTKAKDRRRIARNEVREIQIQAESFKRHEAAAKRDQDLEKRRAKAEGLDGGKTPAEKQAESEAAFERKVKKREATQQQVLERRARTERRKKKKAAEAAKKARNRKPASAASGVSVSGPILPAASASAAASLSQSK